MERNHRERINERYPGIITQIFPGKLIWATSTGTQANVRCKCGTSVVFLPGNPEMTAMISPSATFWPVFRDSRGTV